MRGRERSHCLSGHASVGRGNGADYDQSASRRRYERFSSRRPDQRLICDPISLFSKTSSRPELQQVEGLLARLITRSLEVLLAFLARTFTILMVPFLAFYFLRDADTFSRQFVSLLPADRRQEILALIRGLNELAGAFLRGQLILSVLVGLLISVGLALLKVKYALVIGIIAGVFEFIPYFGPAIAAVPAVMFGLMRSPATALWTMLLIAAVHQVEGAVLQPHVMSGSLDLHPLTVIAAVLIGGSCSAYGVCSWPYRWLPQ